MHRCVLALVALAGLVVAVCGCGSLEFAPTDPSWTGTDLWRTPGWSGGDVTVTGGGHGNVGSGEFPLIGRILAERSGGASATIRRVDSGAGPAEAANVLGTVEVHEDAKFPVDANVIESVPFAVPRDAIFQLRIDRDVTPDRPLQLGDEANYLLEITTEAGTFECPLRMRVVRGKPAVEWWQAVLIVCLSPVLVPVYVVVNAYSYIAYGYPIH
jgi:hypothetical protein